MLFARVMSFLIMVSAVVPTAGAQESPQDTLQVLHRVADWQLAHPSSHRPVDWTQAVGYLGFMALFDLPGGERYEAAMVAVGQTTEWKLGRRCRFNADDQAVGQMYLALSARQHRPEMSAETVAVMREFCERPDAIGSMSMSEAGRRWTWCDALFMAPPVLARLYAMTGEARYLEALRRDYQQTQDFLYDPHEHLFARDETYLQKREANGQKVFWGRGNGWVLAGLALVLQALPADAPGREGFVATYVAMAQRVMGLQQADGLWRASLLDPASYPLKESSGSALYCYALAWGLRHGLLDPAVARPVVDRAWAALHACVAEDGRLTHVQPIGKDPKAFEDTATEIYGVGAFLMAGVEVYGLAAGTP